MLTINLDVEDHLINGSIGTIQHIFMNEKDPLNRSRIYVQFDDSKAGNKRKNRKINKDWVEIVPEVKSFRRNGHNTQRKQFPGVIAFAITIHKSQGSTYEYMQGSLDNAYNKPGMAYTMLSCAKSRSGLLLNNFKCNLIKTNQKALLEIERLRNESNLKVSHPLLEMKSPIILLLNIERSWNSHVQNILADPNYFDSCSMFCFTETNVKEVEKIKRVNELNNAWEDIHVTSEHGLAICYRTNEIQLVCELATASIIESCAYKFRYKEYDFIIVLIYRKPGPKHEFVRFLTEQVSAYKKDHSECRIIILGDFNLDQLEKNNIDYFAPLNELKFKQKVDKATHNMGGILDLIFDNYVHLNFENIEVLPTAFSDHFKIFYSLEYN